MTITKTSTTFPNKGVEHLIVSLGSNHESIELVGETCLTDKVFFAKTLKLNGRELPYEEVAQLGKLYGFDVAIKTETLSDEKIESGSDLSEYMTNPVVVEPLPPEVREMIYSKPVSEQEKLDTFKDDVPPLGKVTSDLTELTKSLFDEAQKSKETFDSVAKKRR